jgi:hypothetical protein
MSEKNYVVNVKTARNTIVTVRGDSAAELANNVNGLIQQGLNEHISVLEEVFLGVSTSAPVTQSPATAVAAAMGGTIVAEVPRPQLVKTEPAQSSGPACRHGQMEWVAPANKPWKGWFCPQPKEATDKCAPQFAKG